ncbi:putative secreted protein [Peptoniphilus sp. ING2-D1G]|nr:putative secreted protein [Peptoniphilus sp. ING2-D1G]
MNKYVRILLSFVVLLVLLPNAANAAIYEASSTDEIKAAIENAQDGDTINIRGLNTPKDFGNAVISVSKNLTIKADMEYEPYNSPYGQKFIMVYEDARLHNVSFEIAEGKTLTLTHVEIKGAETKPAVFGDGNLLVTDRTGIHAKNEQDAVYLPKGSVEITGIQDKKTNRDYSDLQNKVMNEMGETTLRSITFPVVVINGIYGGSSTGESA